MDERESLLGVVKGYLRMKRYQDAIDELETLQTNLGICDDSFDLMIYAFIKIGDVKRQMDYSRAVLFETDLKHSGAWVNLIFNYGSAGNLRAARICVARALIECPGDANVNYEAARLYCSQGDLPRAAKFMMYAIGYDLDKRVWLAQDPDFERLRLYFKRGMS
ncbi:hypothetical protein [Pelagicoccus sp. SDUM812002]|uniref:tetratricopeptide repeat protein n=1 Tax=Pelagicoccus sp. SDUM812002 TaxID=3041266 RepID=UPI00280F3FB2|nr:hypothetical protein [Pelagicoccus sp. SDUM812002]MDQ8188156.1 hypothetical protein [Pelagicoccus sp. SDUM812002]